MITTHAGGNYRDGLITGETRLTSGFVQKNGIRVIGMAKLDDARGTEGQPLVVENLMMEDGQRHDVVFVGDMSNRIYAFDLHTQVLLWKHVIGIPIIVTKAMDMWQINPTWGICSTPVIDLPRNAIYFVTYSSPDGSQAKGEYWFHARSLIDGRALYPAISFTNVTATTPSGSGKHFNQTARKQRAALTLTQDAVFVPFGTFAESSAIGLGFIVVVDVSGTPKVATAWASGDLYQGPGIWMAGAGLSVDDDGFLYAMTGNGGFSPPGDWGECFLRFQYTRDPANLTVVDWHSPYTDAARAGLNPTNPTDKGSTAEEDMEQTPTNASNGPTTNEHKVGDQDLGSGGPLMLPKSVTGYSKNLIMGAGKDGLLMILDADNMGKTQLEDFAPDKIAGNYAHLLAPVYGYTYYPGNSPLMPTQLDYLPIAYGGYTHHLHGQPVAYQTPDHGFVTYCQGENGPVRAIKIGPDFQPVYLACGQEIASAGMKPPGGMPGGMLMLSCTAQGDNTAILWALMPLNDNANQRVVQGRLVAYGANWVDQNGHLIKLWDSHDWNLVFSHNKFNRPGVCSGKVVVPTYDGTLLFMG